MDSRKMFYGANEEIFHRAKKLRDNMTEAESLFWSAVKQNQILGLRFKPQHPIDSYIVDFYCHKLGLVIEIDGPIHNIPYRYEYDAGRTHDLEQLGLKVIRYSNGQIIENLDKVLEDLKQIITLRKQEIQSK